MTQRHRTKDLFGKAVTDCYHKKQKSTFFMCDEKGEYPLDLGFFINNKPDDYECEMLKYAKGKILEVGCGAGRIMKYLQEASCDMTGFDIDRAMVKLCKERDVKNVTAETYLNMKKLGIFDTIIALNRTIGIAGTMDGVRAMIEKCHACTQENGILIFDSLEVRPELSTPSPGVYQRKLRYRYEDQYGDWFNWVNFSSDVARKLVAETSWKEEKMVRHEDTYCMLCRRV